MQITTKSASAQDVLPLRARLREEVNSQIVHDSIHRRPGWTKSWLLELDGAAVGFGSIAIAGPWKDKPTVFEFYVLPAHRDRAFDLFEAFLAASEARFLEMQTNEPLAVAMTHTYGREIISEKIVFQDKITTALPSQGATLRRVTSEEETRQNMAARGGSCDWVLELDGAEIGKGGIAFHYNPPYADVYMGIDEAFRRRGLGSYLVQELKRECYQLGAVPGARCNVGNTLSRKTLQKAGFVPCGHILIGAISGV